MVIEKVLDAPDDLNALQRVPNLHVLAVQNGFGTCHPIDVIWRARKIALILGHRCNKDTSYRCCMYVCMHMQYAYCYPYQFLKCSPAPRWGGGGCFSLNTSHEIFFCEKLKNGAPIHLFRTCCENFRPRSRKVRSPGHVK